MARRRRRKQAEGRSELLKGKWRFTRGDRELIAQTYYSVGTYMGTGKKLGIPASSVMRVIKEGEGDPALGAVRARVLDSAAGKAADLVDRVGGSIKASDLETSHYLARDKWGNPMRSVTVGPGLKEKAYAMKVFGEQSSLMIREADRLRGNTSGDSGLLLPDTLEAAKSMLLGKMRRLRIDVEFSDSVRSGAEAVGIVDDDLEEVEVGFDELAPFDD